MKKKKTKLLVIDDEVHLTRMVKINLEGTGRFEVLEENHGSRGLATAHAFKPDLIFRHDSFHIHAQL